MPDLIYNNLFNNRMLRNNDEIVKYEHSLELLADNFSEADIVELCSTFDDKTCNSEVMFSAIHLLETISSELAYQNTIIGVVKMFESSPEWANIIIYRILNDDYSVQMIKNLYSRLDKSISEKFKLILKEIKQEDSERFGKNIDKILESNA